MQQQRFVWNFVDLVLKYIELTLTSAMPTPIKGMIVVYIQRRCINKM